MMTCETCQQTAAAVWDAAADSVECHSHCDLDTESLYTHTHRHTHTYTDTHTHRQTSITHTTGCMFITLHKVSQVDPPQWCSQALKSGSAQRVWGTEVPQQGPGAKPPEARYIQTICSCQMLFYAGLLPSPSSISPNLPPQKNPLDLCKSHDPTRPVQGGHVGPWLRY